MANASQKLTLKLTLLSLCVHIALPQRLPPNNCGNTYRYERQGDHWIGHVTASQDGLTDVTWKLRFVSHGVNQPGIVSSLSAYPDDVTNFQRMLVGGRSECFVRFDGYQNELPKIVEIKLNDQVLCSASEYGAPSTTITRQLQLSISSKTEHKIRLPSYLNKKPIISFSQPATYATASSTQRPLLFFNQKVTAATSTQIPLFLYNHKVTTVPSTQRPLLFFNQKVTQAAIPATSTERTLLFFNQKVTPPTYTQTQLISFNQKVTTSTDRPLLFHNQKVTTVAPPRTTSSTAKPIQSFVPTGNQWNQNPFLSMVARPKPTPVTVNKTKEPAADECGLEGFGGLQIGGETVPRGRFPWLAALYHDSSVDSNRIDLAYKCVTTLISRRTVITAAHCIYDSPPAQLRVYVGRHDVNMHPEKDATLMSVESVRTHPDFVGNLVPDSDLGLLILTEPVQYSFYVRPICLWNNSTSLGIDDSEQAAVAGWGVDSTFKPTRFPMTVNVRPVSREECLREMVTAKDFLTPRTLCAGNSQGHGPCLGDSGGGLMVLRNNRWMVRGIVSLAQRAGNGCDLSRFVIYCDVARHLSWIEQNVVR